MAKANAGAKRSRKPLVWRHGEVKSPPFSPAAKREAGVLLRLLQEGEKLEMPLAKPLPQIGPRCGELRIRDRNHNWRIIYHIEPDAVVILDVFAKKSQRIPQEVIERCKKRLRQYRADVRQSTKNKPGK